MTDFSRMTDRARRCAQLANQAAQQYGHEIIRPCHLFLGLFREGQGVAANVLKNLDVDLKSMEFFANQYASKEPGVEGTVIGRLPNSPELEDTYRLAIEEATALNHNYVGTEHLLLGLLHDETIVSLFGSRNLTIQEVRDEILNLYGHDVVAKPTTIKSGYIQIRANDSGSIEVTVDGKIVPGVCEIFFSSKKGEASVLNLITHPKFTESISRTHIKTTETQ